MRPRREPEQFSGGRQPRPRRPARSTQTPEQPALPELTTDTYGNAAVGYQAAVVSANEYTSRIGMDILEAGGNAVDAAVAMIFANSLTEPGAPAWAAPAS